MVTFHTDVTFTLHCPLDFHYYPFDSQACRMPFRHLLPNTNTQHTNISLKVQSTKYPDWDIIIKSEPSESLQEGEFYAVSIQFKRKIQSHVLHLYIPSLLLCIASAFSLFIPRRQMAARGGLSSTTSLTLITLFVGQK